MNKNNDKTESGPTFYQTARGKLLPSVYASALGRYYPYGGTFDMPRQQMYMPLDHVNAGGGYLAPILPMHFDKGTQIYRDTTALPFAHGGKLMDFPAPSLSERETNINYNIYASMPGRYYSNGGQFLTAGGEYHRIYKNAEGDIMVNHPAEDKGKWDTINLTDKANAHTVAQGVAATKQWHLEHPNAYSNGGMIKRADGSYSQRGLWDNIRANKGSGKKPTKEMLAQERKIRANEHSLGGNIVKASHLFGMGGHKAVFFPTNVSEPGAADKDLTYPKDAYVYAGGGHLYPNGGKICPEGYFFDEETQSCEPILQRQELVPSYKKDFNSPQLTLEELKLKHPDVYNRILQNKSLGDVKNAEEVINEQFAFSKNKSKKSSILNPIYWGGLTRSLETDLNNVKYYYAPNSKGDEHYATVTKIPDLPYSVKVDKNKPEYFDDKTKTLYVPSENNFHYKKFIEHGLLKKEQESLEQDLIKEGYKTDVKRTAETLTNQMYNNIVDKEGKYVLDPYGRFISAKENELPTGRSGSYENMKNVPELFNYDINNPYWLPAELKNQTYENFYKNRRKENIKRIERTCPGCGYNHNIEYSYDNDYVYSGDRTTPKTFSLPDWENLKNEDFDKFTEATRHDTISSTQGVSPFPPEVMSVPTEKILPRNLQVPEPSRNTQWKQNPITGTWYEDESYSHTNKNTPWTDERPLGMESYNLNTGTYWTDEDAKRWQQQELKKQAKEAQKKSGQFNTITVPEGFANGGHLFPDGGPIYTYAGRPNAKYKKENDSWLISIDGGNKFKPIYDPKGERTALLNAQAKPIITTNYDPLLNVQIGDNTRTVIPNQAIDAVNTHLYMESPEYKAKQKAEKATQAKFEKEQWNKYKNASIAEKVGDRILGFAVDPFGMPARVLTGEQGYIPGMGNALVDSANPNYERYNKALGRTVGQFELSDFQNMINPGYWAASAGNKFATNRPIEGATELGLMALGLKAGMPGVNTAKQTAKILNAAPEYLTTQTLLKNAYKINPYSLKENPEVLLHRVQQPGQTEEYIMKHYGKDTQPGWGRAFSSDQADMSYYTNSSVRKQRGYLEDPEILRLKLPKKDIEQFNIYNFNEAQKAKNLGPYAFGSNKPTKEFVLPIQEIIKAEKFGINDLDQLLKEADKFNTPHWWRGYPQVEIPINQNISKKSISSFIPKLPVLNEMIGGAVNKNRQEALRDAEEWMNNWVQHPATQQKITESYKEALGNRVTPGVTVADHVIAKHNLDELIKQASGYNATNRLQEYPLKKQLVETFLPNKPHIHEGNVAVSYSHHFLPEDFRFVPNYKSELLNPPRELAFFESNYPYDRTGNYVSRQLNNYNRTSSGVHELGHDWLKHVTLKNTNQNKILSDAVDQNAIDALLNEQKGIVSPKEYKKFEDDLKYLADESEMHARLMQARRHFNLSPSDVVTPNQVDEYLYTIREGNTPIDPMWGLITKEGEEGAKLFNKAWATVPAIGIGAATLPNAFKQENGLANGGHMPTEKTIIRTSELFK